MTIQEYINNITRLHKAGKATEHSFRGDLQRLIESLITDVQATNEPKRQACGAPDYILTKNDIPIGYIETKNIGDNDLLGNKKTGNKEQFDRYKKSLNNIIFTDYLDFHLYKNGAFVMQIAIAELQFSCASTGVPEGRGGGSIVALPDNFVIFGNLLRAFCIQEGQTINSPKELAKMMANKARLLGYTIDKALNDDIINQENTTLNDQLKAFRQILIHDITPQAFADVYAQTIAYGMFAARLHDSTLPTFSRQKAAELIPKSNPFLRKLFGYIAGPDLDDRIKWIVDSLIEIFLACDVATILKNYGKSTKMEDPIIHFYETFLTEYDPQLRKTRGVWYTPAPVVRFIVRAVDDILIQEFGLPQGLADHSKIKIKTNEQNKIIEQEIHRVQILDPATGTGTFLAEVVKLIHQKMAGNQGIWNSYIDNHLLPRLNGFELLMASYAMAHLQLDLLLKETGHQPTANADKRFKIYLTNSLEESHPDTTTMFANWLSNEANEANHIKRDAPVMCIIGNPPYSGVSANNGKWISALIEDYKYIDGVHFKERKHWLNDDYVKFIRFSSHLIEKNGEGILAFINPHGYLDNPTFRGMRWHLMHTYDKVYTIDLHGNAKKKETAPDGTIDQNIFDIMQGVSVNIFIKKRKLLELTQKNTDKNNQLAQVFHFDVYGKRQIKYDFLDNNSLNTVRWNTLNPEVPYYFFVPKNNDGQDEYQNGFGVNEIFIKNVTGIVTMGDEFAFAKDKQVLLNRLRDFKEGNLSENELKNKYNLGKNYAEFILKNKAQLVVKEAKLVACAYRPFDNRWTYFDNKILWRWRIEVMQHFINKDNLGLVTVRRIKTGENIGFFITNKIGDDALSGMSSSVIAPLYLYPASGGQGSIDGGGRVANLNMDIVQKMAAGLGLGFETSSAPALQGGEFSPVDILDYIYAVLHSPRYRAKYNEFLKIDFPKVPYPTDAAVFWALVRLGAALRQVHLMEASAVAHNHIAQYPTSGDNVVGKVKYDDGNKKVYINDTQYFDNVPLLAWEFYIGGYQPAQKWLKDRKDTALSFEDILHYQKIIGALVQTDNLMIEIDKLDF